MSGEPRALNSVDLNLLKALDVLLQERSVTRAAHRLALTQPTMSAALRRLRALFDDELLLRDAGGMQSRVHGIDGPDQTSPEPQLKIVVGVEPAAHVVEFAQLRQVVGDLHAARPRLGLTRQPP